MSNAMREIMKEELEEAAQEGRMEGRQDTMVASIRNIMESFGVTIEKAMDSLKVPKEQRAAYAGLVIGMKT